jgi:GNAT superfamily N-acetyltransferase
VTTGDLTADAAPVPPEPWQEQRLVTRDGMELQISPINESDAERLVAFHATLSEESIYFRFFSTHPKLTPAEIDRFTHVDGASRVALLVLDEDRIVAVGRYDRLGNSPEAEVAFVVSDAYQKHGLATALLNRLAVIARAHGIETFVALTLADNRRMRGVFVDAGYDVHSAFCDGNVVVTFGIGARDGLLDAMGYLGLR